MSDNDPRCYCTDIFFPCRYCFYAPEEPPDEQELEDKALSSDAYKLRLPHEEQVLNDSTSTAQRNTQNG